MKIIVGMTLFLALVCHAFGQQTNTDCHAIGDTWHCTTQTQQDSFTKGMEDAKKRAEANKAARAAQAEHARQLAEAQQAEENHAIVNIVYCRKNPEGTVLSADGSTGICSDELAYEQAFCVVNPELDRCKLPKSVEEMEKEFSTLLEQYQNDHPNRGSTKKYYDSLFEKLRKRACIAFPERSWPRRDGTMEPCGQ